MARDLDTLLTGRDRAWLKAIDRAMEPRPVVSVECYCAMVDANDFITRQNRRLWGQKQRLERLGRDQQRSRRFWRQVAITLAVALLAAVAALLRG
jgi:anti-sigma-K factor RskA